MSTPTSPAARPTNRAASGRPGRAEPDQTALQRRPRRVRTGELAIDTTTRALIDLRTPAAATLLPRGRAAGRYACPACGARLELAGPRRNADFTTRFRHDHDGSDRCQAHPQAQAAARTAAADVAAMVAWMRDAQPTLSPQITVTAGAETPGGLLLAVGFVDGSRLSVVHVVRTPLTPQQTERILSSRTDRERTWVLFDRRDHSQYHPVGTVHVRYKRERQTHMRVRPDEQQGRLAAAGVTVAWREGQTLLLPYGGHPTTHQARLGEDWSGRIASWQADWRISQPRPATGAAWWGLLPVPLLTVAHPPLLTAALAQLAALESAQRGRENYRRGLARAQHSVRQRVSVPVQLALVEQSPHPEPAEPAPPSPSPLIEGAPTAASPIRPGRFRSWWRRLRRRHRQLHASAPQG